MDSHASMHNTQHQPIWWVGALVLFWALLSAPVFAASITSAEVPIVGKKPTVVTTTTTATTTPAATPAATPEPTVAAQNNSVDIGVLLPLSGPNAAMGKALLDAATLALYDMQRNIPLNQANPVVRLLPKDTQGTAEGAQTAMRELLEAQPVAILGPLSSAELEIVLPLRREANIPLISFTNNPSLAGRGAYQFGYFATEQAERIAHYAARQGVEAIAAVTTADGYGRLVVDGLNKALRTEGTTYGPTILLAPAGDVTEEQIAPLVTALKERQKQRQFLFVAETSPRLDQLVGLLAKARLMKPNLVLAGSGMWDETYQLSSPALRGAVFVSTPKEGYQNFVKKYQSTYGFVPPRIASLAYDASALLLSLIYHDGRDAVSDAYLQAHDGFATPANGLVRLRADGQAERRLAVFMADGAGGASVLEAAPAAFE
jgi:branched-chain amino acid transport system substrate-binding protein